MTQIQVSVIVPVYNVKEYLRECLDSIVNQTLTNIEVICVNDSSTDGSLEILKEYEQKDNRIKIINKTKNSGAGNSRNIGLKLAKGNSIIFFDADDYMEQDALEKMYSNLTQNASDICIGRFSKLNQATGKLQKLEHNIKRAMIPDTILFSPDEVAEYLYQFCIGWPWDKLYSANFLKKHNLKYQELRQSNDTYFVLMNMALAEKISIEDNYLFVHRYHENSLEATRKKAPACFYYAMEKLYKGLKHYKKFPLYEKSYINYAVTFPMWHIKSIKDKPSERIMRRYYMKLLKLIKFENYEDESYFYDIKLYHEAMRLYNFLRKLKASRQKEQLQEIKGLLQKIFSVKNIGTHKVFCFCGIKIKIKLKRLVNRLEKSN